MTPIRKALVVALALALAGFMSLAVSREAAAAQNAPSWSTGNQWTYGTTVIGAVATIVMNVRGQTSLTIGTTAYPVWYVNTTTSIVTGGGSISVFSDLWLTVDGLKQAKTASSFLTPTTSVYDPPQPQFVFPLAPGNSWSGTTNVTRTTTGGTTTFQQAYSATVTAEQTITVPAGTFATEVVRSPATGNTYTLEYYSEAVGNSVRTENYYFGTLSSTQNLTSYSYSPGLLGVSSVVWIGLLVLALVVIVAAVFILRRRRPRMPYPQQPGQMPPQQTPPQPPQQPPQQGPPGT